MKNKEEINRSLAITLLRSREAVMDRFRPMLASAKITEQQWRVLRGLSEHGEVEAGKLAYIACILPQSLSRIARNLEKKNLIFMKNDPSDARKILLSLTDEGKILMSRATIDSKEIYSQLIEDFGRENLDQLLEKLNLLQSSLNLKSR
ncbi:MAG: homoprotocatechuate degradation operon regulator HpaR [Paracoccaceae bacterium]|nr:homoprotocatechuate degradation operon regulator HpaR [Paracoccaceae bacterium]